MADDGDSSGDRLQQRPVLDRLFKVLLVEDDEFTLRVVEQLLRSCDYEVTLARNGREALEILDRDDFLTDLILTDLMMPEVSGMELICEVVSNEKFSRTPVIAMSSSSSQDFVLQAFDAGASDYLIKPIRRNELSTLWKHVWQHKGAKSTSDAEGASYDSEGKEREHATEVSHTVDSGDDDVIMMGNGEQRSGELPPRELQEGVACHLQGSDIEKGFSNCAQGAARWGNSQLVSGHSSHQASDVTQTRPALDVPVHLEIKPLHLELRDATLPSSWGGSSQSLGCYENSSASLPTGLRELAVLGASLDQERISSRGPGCASDGSAPVLSGSLGKLHHSSSSSAFTWFTAVVPRPCTRGDLPASKPNLWQSGAVVRESPAVGTDECQSDWQASGAAANPQQEAFLNLVQAAVETQTGILPGAALSSANTAANRRAAILRFREKRQSRTFFKKVRYESRRRLADARPRVRGQFVTAEVAAAYHAEAAREQNLARASQAA